MSLDQDARRLASSTARQIREAENLANQNINRLKNNIIDSVVSSLPPPLNAAARLLGNAIYAALKVPVDPVRQPVSLDADPIKSFAFSIAFAIIQAIWCFIKSLLNPLPIIGSFFPLCETPNEPENTALNKSKTDYLEKFSSSTNNENARLAKSTEQANSLQNAVSSYANNTEAEVSGITFQEFLQKNGISSGNQTNNQPLNVGVSTNNPTTANTTPEVENRAPDWQPGEQTFDSVRKRFGL